MCLLNPGVDPPESVFSLFFFPVDTGFDYFLIFPKMEPPKVIL